MKKPKEFKGFKLYTKKPNTLSKGALYIKEIFVNVRNDDKKRFIRVYLPSNYDFNNPNRRFPVMYMMDGKNLFDHYTSFVGEWNVDETIEESVSKNDKGLIVVGIDSATTETGRTNEMLIESKYLNKKWFKKEKADPCGSIIAKYMFEKLKPLIDETFYTLSDKANTGVGGSSMGGLYSFYLGNKYKDKVSFSLCFAPAFALYKENKFKKELKKNIKDKKELGKFFFFVGNDQLDKTLKPLTEYTYEYFETIGFDNNQARYIFDSQAVHNEKPWAHYFKEAISWWGILEKEKSTEVLKS